MALVEEEIKTDFGQCTCCFNYACLKPMWEQHLIEGEEEIYGQMIVDCFSISWKSQGKANNDQICVKCVSRLRDAVKFKKQVLRSQENMIECEVSVAEDTNYDIQYDSKYESGSAASEASEDNTETYENVEFLEDEVLEESENQSISAFQPAQKKRKRSRIFPTKIKADKQYKKEDLDMALEAVESKQMTASEAAKECNIPRKTIDNNSKAKNRANLNNSAAFERSKMKDFLNEIKAILAHTNATPFRRKGNSYYCFFCPRDGPSFEDPEQLRTHTHSVHSSKMTQIELAMRPYSNNQTIRIDIKAFKCNCGHNANWHDMLDHLENIHTVAIDEARKRIIPFVLTEFEMTCALCDFTSTFTNIDAHMNAHSKNYICDDCGETFLTIVRLKSHVKTHQVGVYPCNMCDKIFTRQSYRRKHVDLVHKRRLLYKCIHCPVRFSSETLRSRHVKDQHLDKLESKTRYCKECDTFILPIAYPYHMKRFHGEYVCEECGKCFQNARALEDHRFRHTGVKNFKCDVCFNSYFSPSAVLMHKRYKHPSAP